MKKSSGRTCIRTPSWVTGMLVLTTFVYGWGVVVYWLEHGTTLIAVGMSLLELVFAAGFLDALVTRLEFTGETVVLRSLKGARTIDRQSITSVGWAAGVGVSLELMDGSWVKLPYLGNSQGCTNTIRAWLKAAA